MEEEIITLKVKAKVSQVSGNKKSKESAIRDFKETLKGQRLTIISIDGLCTIESISVRRCLK